MDVIEAQVLIQAAKHTASKMRWQAKPERSSGYFQYYTVLWLQNEIREDLYLRMVYRGEKTQTYGRARIPCGRNLSVNLIASNQRILAYDLADQPHANRTGKGLPYYGQTIWGLHRHIWTAEGEGYAEPLVLTDDHTQTIIEAFLQETHITLDGGYRPPPPEQLTLF